jgi:uncharacterized membrane protein YeaQ/YmgE (transglycosylase-associated protein family)
MTPEVFDRSLGDMVMTVITWLVAGLVAGLLASALMRGIGQGVLRDVLVGMVGAVLGGWLFSVFGVQLPQAGLRGTIFVAFTGSIMLLLLIRAFSQRRGFA